MNGPLTLGLFRIGPMRLALLAESVVEVVRGPLDLTPLPEAPWHVLGAFSLRGRPLPAFDLATLIQPARVTEPLRPVDFMVVVRTPVGEMGIQVDEVLGIEEAVPEALAAVSAHEEVKSPRLFDQLYSSRKGGQVFVVLSLAALVAAPEIQGAVQRLSLNGERKGSRSNGVRPYLCLQVGSLALAIPAHEIVHLHPAPARFDSTLEHPYVRGFHRIQDSDTPIVHLASLLGLAVSSANDTLLLVTTTNDCRTGWLVPNPQRMLGLAENEVKPVGETDLLFSECFVGSAVDDENVTRLLLSLEKLASLDRAIKLPQRKAWESTATQSYSLPPIRHYMIFKGAEGHLGCDICEIERVHRLPKQISQQEGPQTCTFGYCTLDGEPTLLVNLGVALSRKPAPVAEGAPLIVVRHGTKRVGLVVDRLSFLHRGRASELPPSAGRRHGLAPPFSMAVRAQHEGTAITACLLPIRGLLENLFQEESSPPREITLEKIG